MFKHFKNRNLMNDFLFDKFVDYLKDYGRPIPLVNRYIKMDLQQRQDCSNIKFLEKVPIATGFTASLFELNGKRYFAVTGLENFSASTEDYNLVIPHQGVFLRIVCELDIMLKRTNDKSLIYNEIMFQHNDPDYDGHDFTDITKYIQQITVMELDQNSVIYEATASQLFGYLFSLNSDNLFLQYTPDVLNMFMRVFTSNSVTIYYHNLAKSLVSVHWKDSFLEVYRCIESVFHSIEYIEIYNKCNLSVSLKDFSKMLETSIGHKPSEEQSLKTIFKNVTLEPINLIQKIKPPSELHTKDASWFYSIRNSIVHSRPALEEVSFDTTEWNVLLLASLHIVMQCHEMYGLTDLVLIRDE